MYINLSGRKFKIESINNMFPTIHVFYWDHYEDKTIHVSMNYNEFIGRFSVS